MEIKIINEREYKKRFKEISELHRLGVDNDLKVRYSLSNLKKAGSIFQVNPPLKKNRKMKLGSCYLNAIRRMQQGYQYVEGIITSRESGLMISHAWNVDSNGNHIDYTIMDTHNYEYWGVILPPEILYEIGELNGHIWYCNLPYLTV